MVNGIEYTRNELDALITSTSGLIEMDYTAESWVVFAGALASAQMAAENENAVLDDYLNVISSLKDAMENLVSWEAVNTEIEELPEVKNVTLQYKEQIYLTWTHYLDLSGEGEQKVTNPGRLIAEKTFKM